MIWKTTLVGLLLMCMAAKLTGQENSLHLPDYDEGKPHFGYALSLNSSGYDYHLPGNDSVGVDVRNKFGFDMGIVAAYHFSKRVGLRFMPAIDFQEREVFFEVSRRNGRHDTYIQKLESSLLRFPLLAKISYDRNRNKGLYFLAGGFYNIDVSKRKEVASPGMEETLLVRTSRSDYGMCWGLGLDFYLKTFKMAVELKVNKGFKNILSEPNGSPFDKLKTQSCAISFIFEA